MYLLLRYVGETDGLQDTIDKAADKPIPKWTTPNGYDEALTCMSDAHSSHRKVGYGSLTISR
jgi:hypothetical protein